jgi:ABC-type multidrug transport system fused ATPase/permease subunit
LFTRLLLKGIGNQKLTKFKWVNRKNMVKKSFYVFVCGLLGALLFLILDRIIVFVYLFFVGSGLFSNSYDYYQFALFDYFTLIIVLMFGAWYGVWLGMNWFSQVYENETHGGLVDHISKNLWVSKKITMESKLSDVKERLEKNLWELEDLTEMPSISAVKVEPKVRHIVRRKAIKKIK